MAPVSTRDVSNITMQQLNDLGLNPFAVQLLVESYARPTIAPASLEPLRFVWRGVRITLERCDDPLQEGT